MGTAQVRHDPEPLSDRPITDTRTTVFARHNSFDSTPLTRGLVLPGESLGLDEVREGPVNTQARQKRQRIEGSPERTAEIDRCE